MQRISASVQKDTKENLESEASNQKRSEASLIRKVLTDYLEDKSERHEQ